MPVATVGSEVARGALQSRELDDTSEPKTLDSRSSNYHTKTGSMYLYSRYLSVNGVPI